MEINGPVLFELVALIASIPRKTGVERGFANKAIVLGWWLRSGAAGKKLAVVFVCLHLIRLELTEGGTVGWMLVAIAVVGAIGTIENMFLLVLGQETKAWCWVLG